MASRSKAKPRSSQGFLISRRAKGQARLDLRSEHWFQKPPVLGLHLLRAKVGPDRPPFLQSTLAPAGIGEPVRRIETHMSWLLLGGNRVLKLKKPVRFSLLDLTTVQARERNAHAELRVNRRLAPHVYLGLLALQWDAGTRRLKTADAYGHVVRRAGNVS